MKIIKKDSLKKTSEFINEIQMLKDIDHPNVLRYYEYYEDKHNYYIITEYCAGGELINHILCSKGLDEKKTAFIMK
jgi:calcium-dependent protein kinase